jgi:acyl carrier protein
MPAETHVQRGPIGPDEVLRLVREVLTEVVGPAADGVEPGDRLVDLGVDGLGVLALVEGVEQELGERTVGFALDDDDLADLETVGDVVDVVVARVGGADA